MYGDCDESKCRSQFVRFLLNDHSMLVLHCAGETCQVNLTPTCSLVVPVYTYRTVRTSSCNFPCIPVSRDPPIVWSFEPGRRP